MIENSSFLLSFGTIGTILFVILFLIPMNHLERFRSIETFIFDIDGVLTSGHVLLTEEGKLLRIMSVRDGYAMKVATLNGFRICIISGGVTPGVEDRLSALGIKDIHLGVMDKVAVYKKFVSKYGLSEGNILYMGDDLPDFDVMQCVGLPCCPKNAIDEIRDLSLYISSQPGGEGCVRDVIEKVLKLKGLWPGYPTLKIKTK